MDDIAESKAQRGVGTIEASGRLLQIMAGADGAIKLRDPADALAMVPSQLHPYLVSLRKTGLVEQVDRGRYRLGPFALRLGLARLRYQDVYREALGPYTGPV